MFIIGLLYTQNYLIYLLTLFPNLQFSDYLFFSVEGSEVQEQLFFSFPYVKYISESARNKSGFILLNG